MKGIIPLVFLTVKGPPPPPLGEQAWARGRGSWTKPGLPPPTSVEGKRNRPWTEHLLWVALCWGVYAITSFNLTTDHGEGVMQPILPERKLRFPED